MSDTTVGGATDAGRPTGVQGAGNVAKNDKTLSTSEANGIAAKATGTPDAVAVGVGEKMVAAASPDTVQTKPAEEPGVLESVGNWIGQTAKGYGTGAVNGVLDMANLVNTGVNAGLGLTGIDYRFQTNMKMEATSPAEQAAQNAVTVATIATGVAGAVKSAPALARTIDGALAWGKTALGVGAKEAPAIAEVAASTAKLGDLSVKEVAQIQAAADKLGQDIYVVGSAAKGSRRAVGSDLPLSEFGGSKAGTRSDIDYAVKSGFDDAATELGLPDVDPGFGVRGIDYLNLDASPAIRFSPGKPPALVEGTGRINLN